MGLGGAHRLGGDFKVFTWGQATRGWDHFLFGELTPRDTKLRFHFGTRRRAMLDKIVKKWDRERFYI